MADEEGSGESTWMDRLDVKICDTFESSSEPEFNSETYARITFHLGKEEADCSASGRVPATWRTLQRAALFSDVQFFKTCLLKLNADLMKAEAGTETKLKIEKPGKKALPGKPAEKQALPLERREKEKPDANLCNIAKTPTQAGSADVVTAAVPDELLKNMNTWIGSYLPNGEEWMNEVRTKIYVIFTGATELDDIFNPRSYSLVLTYLNSEEVAYRGDAEIGEFEHGIPPVWKTLRSVLSSDKLFVYYLIQIYEDIKKGQTNKQFLKKIGDKYNSILDPSEESRPDREGQGFERDRLVDPGLALSGVGGAAYSWHMVPAETQRTVLRIVNRFRLVTCVDEVVGCVNSYGGTVAMLGLAAIQLGWSVYQDIKRWYNGEITGIRCVKLIVDQVATIGAGIGGGMAGAAISTCIWPGVGTLIGGIAGSLGAAAGVNFPADRLTQVVFGLPKTVALENGYRYLGVHMRASNHEINKAYHAKCRELHPDKNPGKTADFQVLQIHMAVIKCARGDSG